MNEEQLKRLILEIYDLPLGKICSDFLQDIIPFLDEKTLKTHKRIVPAIETLCLGLQNLYTHYKQGDIDKTILYEECAKLAIDTANKTILIAVETVAKTEITRTRGMRYVVRGRKAYKSRSQHMKSVKKEQGQIKNRMKIIYNQLSEDDKSKKKVAIKSMTERYKEIYNEDCNRSLKTCQNWIREWTTDSK